MKKRIVGITFSFVLACASVAILVNRNNTLNALANDECEGNHYSLLEPTETTPGHREFWTCCKHVREIFLEEPTSGIFVDQEDSAMTGGLDSTHEAYLPALSETYYTRTESTKDGYDLVTWTLKDSEDDFAIIQKTKTPTFTFGSGSYSIRTFNAAYKDNVVATYDEQKNTVTFDVVNENGYTLNGKILCTDTNITLKFTGYPLTVISLGTAGADGIKVEAGGSVIIDNDLSLHTNNYVDSTADNTGIVASNVTINENANVTIENFLQGFYFHSGNGLVVNGNLDASGVNAVIYNTNRKINIKSDKVVLINDAFVEAKPTTGQCGKHIIVSDDKGETLENYFSDIVFDSIETEPTLTTTGLAKLKCGKCGQGIVKELVLPVLSDENYDLQPVTVKDTDGKVYDTTSYVYKVKTYGTILIQKEAREISTYISAGSSYYSVDTLNYLFTNQHAVETEETAGKVLTMTLDGEQTMFANDGKEGPFDGTMNFTKYNKVVINGEGTLNLTFSAPLDGVLGNNLVIDSGVTVNIVGSSAGNDKSGMKLLESLVLNGNLNVSKFGYAQYAHDPNRSDKTVDVTINAGAKYVVTDCANGFGTYQSSTGAKVDFQIYGEYSVDVSGNGIEIVNSGSLKVAGNAKLTVKANGFAVMGRNAQTETGLPTFNFGGNAVISITSGNHAIYRYQKFILGDIDAQGNVTKCNAKLTITTGGNAFTTGQSDKNTDATPWTTIINSSEEVMCKTTGTGKTAISVNNRYMALEIHSNITVEDFDNGFYFYYTRTVGTLVYDNSNPPMKLVNCKTLAAGLFDSGYSCLSLIKTSRP